VALSPKQCGKNSLQIRSCWSASGRLRNLDRESGWFSSAAFNLGATEPRRWRAGADEPLDFNFADAPDLRIPVDLVGAFTVVFFTTLCVVEALIDAMVVDEIKRTLGLWFIGSELNEQWSTKHVGTFSFIFSLVGCSQSLIIANNLMPSHSALRSHKLQNCPLLTMHPEILLRWAMIWATFFPHNPLADSLISLSSFLGCVQSRCFCSE
jgi:hypothetical protein